MAPDLAANFSEAPWLDLAPNPEAQAKVLSRLECIKPAVFQALLEHSSPVVGPETTPITSVTEEKDGSHASPEVKASASHENSSDPKGFLLVVMNDKTVELHLRIEAATALLSYFEGQDGSGHAIFKAPWPGGPRVNIQNAKGGQALSSQASLAGRRQNGRQIMNIKHYTYRVTWSPEDGEHVGLCAELPSLSWLAKTPEAALKGIQKVVADVVADMLASGEAVPVALAEKNYSGQFRVRIPPLVHRNLALMAAEQGVSLNRLASAKLAA